MGLIDRAFRLLKEFPNFKKEDEPNNSSITKRSFLKEAESYFKTSSYPSLEVEIDNEISDEAIEEQATKADLFTIEEDDELIVLENSEAPNDFIEESESDFVIDLDLIDETDDKPFINPNVEVNEDLIDDSAILEDWERDALQDDFETIEPVLDIEETPTQADVEEQHFNPEKITNSDSYYVLVETTKEILKSKDFDEFFESLMYSLIGQVGIETILIFSSKIGNFANLSLVASEGIELTEKIIINENNAIYKKLANAGEIVKIDSLDLQELTRQENEILQKMSAEILIPINVNEQFSGLIIMGKLISGEEYSITELEFIKNLVDISSNYLSKVLDFESLNTEISELNKVLSSNNRITTFADKIYSSVNIEEVYELTSEFFKNDFKIKKFSLLLHESFHDRYKVFASNSISDSLKEKFYLSSDSKIITMISNLSAIYKLENPKDNIEISEIYSKENPDFIMIPLLNMKRLYGIFVLHQLAFELSTGFKQALVSIGNIIAPIISNILIQKEKDSLYQNPFNPMNNILEKEIRDSESSDEPFTLIVIKILNINRILNILGLNFYSEYIEFISKIIQDNVADKDYISRTGQGKFAVLLKGFNQKQSEKFIEKIKSKIVLFHNPSKDFKLSLQVYSLEYPTQAKEKRKFIEMLEET